MLKDKMLNALNEQIVKELYSSYLYFQMAAWFQARTLPGFANWMQVQAQEEAAHAMIFFKYINDRGSEVELGAIDKPENKFDSPLAVFEKVAAHESLVTDSINNLMDIAIELKDHATKARLDWFVDEQVEEEANAAEIIGKLKMAGNQGEALLNLDKEYAARVFAMPAPLVAGA